MLKNRKPSGRPTIYTDELADRIMEVIATTTTGLKRRFDDDPDLPDHSTITKWRWTNEIFCRKYLEALQKRQHLMIEDLEEVAKDVIYYTDKEGNLRIDAPSVAVQTNILNIRKWHASKIAPKFYGDRHTLAHLENANDELRAELMQLRAELAMKNKKDY